MNPEDQAIVDTAKRQLIDPASLTWMVEHSPVATIVVSQDFSIELANIAAEFLFGYHRSELVGQMIEILVPDVSKETHVKHRNGFADKPRSRPMGEEMELKAKHKSGKEIPVRIVLEPRMTPKGLKVMAVIIPKEPHG